MRIGLGFELDSGDDAHEAWHAVLGEIQRADALGYDSVWLEEGREAGASCPAPTLFLTHAACKTKSIQLRPAARRVDRTHPVRLAEEIAVLDMFSRGRAGVAFASAHRQGVPPQQLHETIDFVRAAWAGDALRFRGEFVRFPSHTPDEAPVGVSHPAAEGELVPQWDWGGVMPDFLAVTPKPYASRPPTYVEIADDATLEWAARHGISPLVTAKVPTAEAVERFSRYWRIAAEAGRSSAEVEAVLARRIALDGEGNEYALGGSATDLATSISALRAASAISHLVWVRDAGDEGQLLQFASEVQPVLQA
ncbi:MAG: LLM class flavin-dependent oxidoreductase [Pseudomonadales bacterium]|jgi:alkanesulfonate monooxygenase SsuD/methylene tetrahydromethanopterin reductase-like flavin-dependent oxidoreductase (luciferase family)|nr:LLM class flavin-dependent oxidoreductase [Pseudomonadales bacterium]MDP6473268.1 LLM class flavin-dependent oxidoreductase [Pseudomonadales bacterium]MDP6829193.1 LLM class flavin-dependent oxidoreductase [Pseudomonadales bacterium]MDP6970824.1 LLM class flavin-dependent oxidoreductase [Pseudomonadales bacterium]|tara:strand:+ start:205 stop:1128 length:924 start_codon:yes stop_codon:yes gene_type:complete